MTDSELIAMVKKNGGNVGPSLAEFMAMREAEASCRLDGETQVIQAKANAHRAGRMNKTEAAYSDHLEYLKKCGDVIAFYFEAIKFRLAEKTWYTPDFMVIRADSGFIEFHEVKGFWRDDARVKFKVAVEMFPLFLWVVVKKTKGGWSAETVNQM